MKHPFWSLQALNLNGVKKCLPMQLLDQQYLYPKNLLLTVNDAKLITRQEQRLERILTRMIARIVAIYNCILYW